MEPVITPHEMQAIDRAAPEPVEILIERAGWAVARAAIELLGRRYGTRVLVVAGKGNNGADGRVAARLLQGQGVSVVVVAASDSSPDGLAANADLVIDAAYGTGFRGTYQPPTVGTTPVLAVDISSGVDGLTGHTAGQPLAAQATVTFAAIKPGLLFQPGRGLAGAVTVADVGLDCSRARAWHLSADDVAGSWPVATAVAHKWQQAVWIIGGSPTMPGAPSLAAAGAGRAGAGYVALSVPGLATAGPPLPIETVLRPVGSRWSSEVLAGHDRFQALVIGPGLATDYETASEVRAVVAGSPLQKLVLDGGAIDAVAADPSALAQRKVPAVLTPHGGELARLLGRPPGPDRLGEVRTLAARLGAIVLAKGPTTVAAHPDGRALISTAGDQRLAAAGTGDVLAGLVGAGLAGGLEPLLAAGLAAELHGGAALSGHRIGFLAGDLPSLVADHLGSLTAPIGGKR